MRNIILYIILTLTVFSCQNNPAEESPAVATDHLDEVVMIRQPRQKAPGMETLELGEAEAIETDNSIFGTESILYISQMGNDNTKDPNFTNDSPTASPYLYKYRYYENQMADWDNEYNFKTVVGRTPIVWETVKELGSVGNAFAFYAMYFPEDQTPVFSVKQDQTGGEEDPYSQTNFIKSDILGAYHSTSGLYTRLRFRLFHLMVYLKVTLYVPVYRDANMEEDKKYSGFKENALKEGFLMGAAKDFSIEWRANRSSDTEAPLVQTGTSIPSIKMYMHKPDNKQIQIDVNNYYEHKDPDNPMDEVDETDDVRAYNFSVLFPPPSASSNEEIKLCFPIESPDGSMKYYYFNLNQIMPGFGNIILRQGTLQQLYLYLPRLLNKTILIGAKILPWGQSDSDMTVFEEGDTFDENNQ